MSPPTGNRRGTLWWRFNRFLERHLPGGLYGRSMLIVIVPMLIFQLVMTGIFLERHWEKVTKALSKSLGREIGLVITLYDQGPKTPWALARLENEANEILDMGLRIEHGPLPPPHPRPIFSILHYRLSKYVARFAPGRPFWIDTTGQDGYVDIRIQVDKGVIFRFLTAKSRAYASSTGIFLTWMAGTSFVLLLLAVIFLHKQIKPILRLADAAQAFGKGREIAGFEPRGAREVRAASEAFLDMKRRIERHVEQRTTMLAGVSHDLRTILTRFRLELSMLECDGEQLAAMRADVDEMQRMLEGYIAFVRDYEGEQSRPTDICELLETVRAGLRHEKKRLETECQKGLEARVKPTALRRAIANLAANAVNHAASRIRVRAWRAGAYLRIAIEDDGPGIPPGMRERVFRPFVRLDTARNQNMAGTGLGLSIALDIAHKHGGDIELSQAALGGLRAEMRIPL